MPAKSRTRLVFFCFFWIIVVCSGSLEATPDPEKEIRRTTLINEFIALCEEQSPDYPNDRFVYMKYYRREKSPEIIFEIKSVKGKEFVPSQEQQNAIRTGFIEQVGTGLSVGEIREYGEHGIVFSFRGVSHDDEELFKIQIRFDEMLEHWGHPNL